MALAWHPASWRERFAAQQPVYADAAALAGVKAELSGQPALVTLGEIRALRVALAEAAQGRAMLLHGGDCAETFTVPDVAGLSALFEELAGLLPLPAIRLARIAGQFAKPRTIEGQVWRGEIVNSRDALEPDPERMLAAYEHAAATRARLPDTLFTSHEALLLPYEQAFVRDAGEGYWSGSAHFLWLGERTRHLNGAHVEFLRGIVNPIGIKLGDVDADELLRLLDVLDFTRELGRVTLIVRMGAGIGARLPALMRVVRKEGRNPLWVSDPLHGNTERNAGRKVRHMPAILREVADFAAIARSEGVHPGGLHLEMTPENVAECSGGLEGQGWTSACDPRLNPRQATAVVRAFNATVQQRDAA